MKFLNDHIKRNEFKQVYLLCGEEEYLKKQYRDKLREAMVGDDTMNYAYYEGKKLDTKEIVNTADTLPFFADRRLLIIENSGFFKSASEDVVNLVKNMPEYLHIIFVDGEIDKRNKLYKAVKDKGYISEMKFQDVGILSRWVNGLLKAENKFMDHRVMELFLTKTGVQMDNIKAELEKVICYTMGKEEITEEDIEKICTTQTTNKIFDMITAIATRQQKKALDLYYDLLLLKEPPMRIMYLITRQFNMMLQVKEMVNERHDNATISKTLGIAPFLVGKYIAQAKGFTYQAIRNALLDFAETEEAVKTGRLDDKTAVELMIIKYSNKQ